MQNVIRGRTLVRDNWRKLEADASPTSGEELLVPLARWRAEREDLRRHEGRLGLWLEPEDDPAAAAADRELFEVIAVNFPRFADGRGYSIARLLRERHGYRGELRAVGDVQRDQLFYLMRCGFDAFALNAAEDSAELCAAFDDFSDAYQASVERPVPLFRRRNEAEGVV